MNLFHGITVPGTVRDNHGNQHTIVHILPDGTILTFDRGQAQAWAPDGMNLSWGVQARLTPPGPRGLPEFRELPDRQKQIVRLTIDAGKNILGIKALRGFISLNQTDAKTLWSQLELRNDTRSNGEIAAVLGVDREKVRRWRVNAVFDPLTGCGCGRTADGRLPVSAVAARFPDGAYSCSHF